MTKAPPPGSNEALDAGCRCPVFDNGHGRGWMGGAKDKQGRTIYVYSSDCEVHATAMEEAGEP